MSKKIMMGEFSNGWKVMKIKLKADGLARIKLEKEKLLKKCVIVGRNILMCSFVDTKSSKFSE
jgi:hypothetical protein